MRIVIGLCFGLLFGSVAQAESHVLQGDAEAGAKAFNRNCTGCHVVMDDNGNKLAGRNGRFGPNLYGLDGRLVGSMQGYQYGASLRSVGADLGLVWNQKGFTGYVADPTGYVRGVLGDEGARAKMSFRLGNAQDAADIYAFLASLGEAEGAAQ